MSKAKKGLGKSPAEDTSWDEGLCSEKLEDVSFDLGSCMAVAKDFQSCFFVPTGAVAALSHVFGG